MSKLVVTGMVAGLALVGSTLLVGCAADDPQVDAPELEETNLDPRTSINVGAWTLTAVTPSINSSAVLTTPAKATAKRNTGAGTEERNAGMVLLALHGLSCTNDASCPLETGYINKYCVLPQGSTQKQCGNLKSSAFRNVGTTGLLAAGQTKTYTVSPSGLEFDSQYVVMAQMSIQNDGLTPGCMAHAEDPAYCVRTTSGMDGAF